MGKIAIRSDNPRERADRLVRTAIDEVLASGNNRLPTVAAMAAEAGVSPVTMSAVLHEFRSAGILDMAQRKGIRLAPDAPSSGVVPTPAPTRSRLCGPRWKRVCADLRHDIATGVFAVGKPLPNVKELTARYGVSYRTMTRVLTELCDESILQQYRRSYLPYSRPSGGGRQTIVLVARGDDLGELSLATQRTRNHLRQLESLCSLASLKLKVVPCYYVGTELQGAKTINALLLNRDTIMGFFIWNVALEPAFVSTLVSTISSARMPTALLDEAGGVLSDLWVGRSRIRMLRVAVDEKSGWLVAQHLLRLGHRAVAFIDNGVREPYTSLRLQGLRRGFAESGFPDAVTVVSPQKVETAPLLGEDEREQFRLIEAVVAGPRFGRSEKYSISHRIALGLREHVDNARIRQSLRESLFPELSALLERPDITAWVAVTDIVAIECLDFLNIESVPVPARISVIGFDDSDDAFVHKLTSFNFNSQAVVQAGFSYLVEPAAAIWRKGASEPFTVAGYVTERATVGPAAGAGPECVR